MNIIFSENAWKDYQFWQTTEKKIIKRINELIKSISRTPFEGIGKPEALKFDKKGHWSRRINQEHRLVYFYNENGITIISCRYHYK